MVVLDQLRVQEEKIGALDTHRLKRSSQRCVQLVVGNGVVNAPETVFSRKVELRGIHTLESLTNHLFGFTTSVHRGHIEMGDPTV